MFDILVIDDDPGTLESYAEVLRAAGFKVVTAQSGEDGLALALERKPHLVIADLNLPGRSGLDILREVRLADDQMAVVIVTGFGSAGSAVKAMRLGACDFVEKPLIGDELVEVAQRALSQSAAFEEETARVLRVNRSAAHAHARWARVVVQVIDSRIDVKTLEAWAHWVGASPSGLKSWCRMARLSTRRSLIFARLLRAVARRRLEGYQPEDYLDVSDTRTLTKLLRIAGATHSQRPTLPPTVEDFLRLQRIILDPVALREVGYALEARALRKR